MGTLPPDRRRRKDYCGDIVFMAEAKGYVMVRRPDRYPFVLSTKEWLELELADATA